VTPPLTARCPMCGHDWPLCPDGHTLTRHYTNRLPASVKHCPGGRKTVGGPDTSLPTLGATA
jgi:hypothetical protein